MIDPRGTTNPEPGAPQEPGLAVGPQEKRLGIRGIAFELTTGGFDALPEVEVVRQLPHGVLAVADRGRFGWTEQPGGQGAPAVEQRRGGELPLQ